MEIKPQELRIGNILKRQDESLFVVGHDDIRIIATCRNPFANMPEPVSLSADVLERLGFVKELGSVDWTFGVPTTTYITPLRLHQFSETLFLDSKYGVTISHVHQLQNLYFALTGEELAIDKTSLI